ncbi:MAG: glucose-6-phosphate isomerase [Janthinobacterium lividum]
MHNVDLTTAASYSDLQTHHASAVNWHLRDLFTANPQRFARFSIEAAGLFFDYSKNLVTDETMALLMKLARECGIEERRTAMFAGERINTTEDRPVLHVALRAPRQQAGPQGGHKALAQIVDGQDVNADIHAVLERMGRFAERVRSGAWVGFSGKKITDIVNIGIGGSFLGPKMVCKALRPYCHARLTLHFVSNVDGHDLDAVLSRVDPATTLFIIASKTFTTQETMMNAQSARRWFLGHAAEGELAKHFVALTSNVPGGEQFGIDADNMFPFWDWVGGRYSIWSSIGLSVAIAVGIEQFHEFLAGAHAMDQHFLTAPLEQNMPVLMAMVGVWNRNFFRCTSLSIAPYHQDLAEFPDYLQQLEMESNGKRVTAAGTPLRTPSCPAIWGDVGTNGQHAFFQLLHQGTNVIPVDFIAALKPGHILPGHHAALLANCFAQSKAFMRGKSDAEVEEELQEQGKTPEQIAALLPHRVFPGNRPSNTILMDALTPATLGALIALYEHKVFVQGVAWGINSFDQWGVELGKVLAKKILQELEGGVAASTNDASTSGLIARARAVQ